MAMKCCRDSFGNEALSDVAESNLLIGESISRIELPRLQSLYLDGTHELLSLPLN